MSMGGEEPRMDADERGFAKVGVGRRRDGYLNMNLNLNMTPAEGPRRRKGTAAVGGRASRVREPEG